MLRSLAITLLLISPLCTMAAKAETGSSSSSEPWRARLLREACSRPVVLLGENSHGDGATIALKARLIPELVGRCGFKAVAFEANYYDFAELRQVTQAQAPYDRAKLLAAVGGLWNRYVEFGPLADWLGARTPANLSIAGIDSQLGAAGSFYAYPSMIKELAGTLPGKRQPGCEAALTHAYARGSAGQPRDEAIDQCLAEIAEKLHARRDPRGRHLAALTTAFQRSVAMSMLPLEDYGHARDRAMADNLLAFRASLPRGTKIIVWTANAHAAYRGAQNDETLAALLRQKLGKKLFTVGFTAAGGQYRWSSKEVRDIPPAMPGSIETAVLGDADVAVASGSRLAQLGSIPGTALSNHQPHTARWSELFDALVVLRREEPKTLLPAR